MTLTGAERAARQDAPQDAPQDVPGPHPAIRATFTREAASTCTQVLTVSAHDWNAQPATITGWELVDGAWQVAVGPFAGYVGPRGMTHQPYELDFYTPVGVYPISVMFGRCVDPGFAFPYRRTRDQEVWVDDPASAYYNTFQVGPANDRWHSAENLKMYPYAFAFGFNADPVIPDGNSAIFFHEGGPGMTVGCITLDTRAEVLEVMSWFHPDRHPHIALGVDLPDVGALIAGADTIGQNPPARPDREHDRRQQPSWTVADGEDLTLF